MNVLKELKDYKPLSQRYKDLDSDYKKAKAKLINEICDKIEKLCKDNSFIEYIFDQFETEKIDIIDFIYYINTMMSACIHHPKMAYDDMDNDYDYSYTFSTEIMPFISPNMAIEIEDIMGDARSDCGYSCFFTDYYLITGTKEKDKVYPIEEKEDLYYDRGTFERVYELDKRFERAIVAYHNMILEHNDRFLPLLEEYIVNY